MKTFYYDLHIHSCLSPCGDNDMTPNNIAGMGVIAKLDIMALTDHNSCRNCPAFFKACETNGIVPVPGMELTTSEDIHIVCLFYDLESAVKFNDFVDSKRIPIKNRTDIFGEQIIMDESDEIIGYEENLLPNATMISVDEVPSLVESFNGICYPAHIDREANGIIATLGIFPDYPKFTSAEFHTFENIEPYERKYTNLTNKTSVVSSDAHYLWDINGRLYGFELDGESPDKIRKALLDRIKRI